MVQDRRELRRRLLGMASRQAGYFTAAQARSVGYSYQAQAHHVGAGNWLRIDRGLFRLVEWPVGAHDDLVRWSLWSKGRGVVSHESSLSVHGVGELESPTVHLTVPPGFTMRDDAVTIHRGELDEEDVVQREGYRVTTLLRAVVDVATGHADEEQLERVIDDALERGAFTLRHLRSRSEAIDVTAALRIERALSRRTSR